MLNKQHNKKLLKFLETRGDKGANTYELYAPKPHGLGIPNYHKHLSFLQFKGYSLEITQEGVVVLKGKQPPRIQYAVPKLSGAQKLQGRNLSQWDRMGAYLMGQASKPRSRKFITKVEKAFL